MNALRDRLVSMLLVPKLCLGTQRKKLRFVPPAWHFKVPDFGSVAPRQGCQKLAGGRRAATTPGYNAQNDPTPEGWQSIRAKRSFGQSVPKRSLGTRIAGGEP